MADLQKVKGVMVETGFTVTPEDRAALTRIPTAQQVSDWTDYITGSTMIEALDNGPMKPPSFYYGLGRRTYWENHKDNIAGVPNAGGSTWSAMLTIIPYYKADDDALTQIIYSKLGTFTRVSVGTVTATATWGAWSKISTFSGSYADLTNKPTTMTPSTHSHSYTDLTNKPPIDQMTTDIASLFSSVSNGKSAVANAITQKGVATSATAEFATMVSNIGDIPSFDPKKYLEMVTPEQSAGAFKTIAYSENINVAVNTTTIASVFSRLAEYRITSNVKASVFSINFNGAVPASNVSVAIQLRLNGVTIAEGTLAGTNQYSMFVSVNSPLMTFNVDDKLQIFVKNGSNSTAAGLTSIAINTHIPKNAVIERSI